MRPGKRHCLPWLSAGFGSLSSRFRAGVQISRPENITCDSVERARNRRDCARLPWFIVHPMIKVPSSEKFGGSEYLSATAGPVSVLICRVHHRRCDGEHLAAGGHEIVRVARVPDLGQACVDRALQHGAWVIGAQLKPGAEPGDAHRPVRRQ